MWQTDGGAKQSTRRGGHSLTKDLQTEHELIRMKEKTKKKKIMMILMKVLILTALGLGEEHLCIGLHLVVILKLLSASFNMVPIQESTLMMAIHPNK